MLLQTDRQTGYPSVDKPWLKYYSEETQNAPLPECTIYEYLVQNNRDYLSDIAILYLGRKITYKELFDNIDKTAAAFLKVGVKEKEIVTVALPSIPEALYCVYALNKIGAVANMIHPLAGKEETLNYLNEVKSKVAVIFDGAYDTIVKDIDKSSVEKLIVASPADSLPVTLKLAYKLKVKRPRFDGKRIIEWKKFIQEGRGITARAVKKDCHEMAIISHTGGTTGMPKGCMLSDYSTNAIVRQLQIILPYERQDVCLVVLPPFVNYSLVDSMIGMIDIGITAALVPKYEPEKFPEYMRKIHPNHISSIPAYWEAIMDFEPTPKDDWACLKNAYYGGEAMSIENEDAVNAIMRKVHSGATLCKGMGATELVSAATMTGDGYNAPGSAGIPLVYVNCKVVNPENGRELKYGEEGEICFSGASLMLGYYNNQEETDNIIRIHDDGNRWLHTGDVGYIDTNGLIFITGRIKRIIMTKGRDGQVTKMFPDRIEKVIYKHQAVELCCVIGVAVKERINYPKAFIVLKDKSGTANVKNEILVICKQNLPEYMVPEEIEFVANLPRTERGKIDYRKLENNDRK